MFSKSCKYAIRAVLFLAVNASVTHKLGAKEIAEELDIPKHFLAKILQQLSRQGLVASTKGTGGGFYLEPQQLEASLEGIITCIDGQSVFTSCILGLPNCSDKNPCPLHHESAKARKAIKDTITNRTIKNVAKQTLAGAFALI